MFRSDNPILVTGGAGYIGSVLVGLLLSRDYKVRVIDNLMYGQNSLDVFRGSKGLEQIKGDIRNSEDVEKAMKGIGQVVHLAAIVGDPACEKKGKLATEVNLEASELLLEKSIEHKVERFVFASTCSNYGRMDSRSGFVDESSPLKPISHYARLKVDFEKFLLSERKTKMTSVVLRFATAYGLSPRPRLDLTLNEFTTRLALGKKLQVYGEQFWRPYCHTHDLARACILSLESDKAKVSGKAFNVGATDENYQKKTLVELILKRIPEAKAHVEFVKKDEDPRDYRVNFDLIKKTLGFMNLKTVVNGISEYLAAVGAGQIIEMDNPVYRNS
jgi:nucleoside-diphosphate-sugar epimerase